MKNGIIGFFVSLLLPPSCKACAASVFGKGELCADCTELFRTESEETCPRCGHSVDFCECGIDYIRHTGCMMGSSSFTALTFYKSRKEYPDTSRLTERMIYALKADGSYASFFADRLAEKIAKRFSENEIPLEGWTVTFIPRTDKKRADGGVDQSEELAERLAKRLGVPLAHVFMRISGEEQKNLSADERRQNMSESLRVAGSVEKGGKYLLADYIITSGASVECAARLLKYHGAQYVYPIAAARTMSPKQSKQNHINTDKESET